jgi:hypothetical protein
LYQEISWSTPSAKFRHSQLVAEGESQPKVIDIPQEFLYYLAVRGKFSS